MMSVPPVTDHPHLGSPPLRRGRIAAGDPRVVEVANDEGRDNTEPVLTRGAITGIVGSVATILVLVGYAKPDEANALVDVAGKSFDAVSVVVALIPVVVTIVGAIWGRAKAWAPHTAANALLEQSRRAYEAGKAGDPLPLPSWPE